MPEGMFRVEAPDLPGLRAGAQAFPRALRTELDRVFHTRGNRALRTMSSNLRSGAFATDVGMREGIASGLRLEQIPGDKQAGVRIVASGSDLPDDKKLMVYAWQADTFQHPVFGDTEVVVTQSGRPYFTAVVKNDQQQITGDAISAMQRAANVLGGQA